MWPACVFDMTVCLTRLSIWPDGLFDLTVFDMTVWLSIWPDSIWPDCWFDLTVVYSTWLFDMMVNDIKGSRDATASKKEMHFMNS